MSVSLLSVVCVCYFLVTLFRKPN